MAVENTIKEMVINYKKKLTLDLLYIKALENNEMKRIDSYCCALDDHVKKFFGKNSSVETSSADSQICVVKKVNDSKLEELLTINCNTTSSQEAASPLEAIKPNSLINVDKVLREVPQESEKQSCVSLNSLNLVNGNREEKTVQIFLSAGIAVAIKLSYALLKILKEPEGIICNRYELTEHTIELINLENVVVAVKIKNVFRKSYTLYINGCADSFSEEKFGVLVDSIEITDVSSTSEVLQQLHMWTDQSAKENFNILPSQTTSDSSVYFDDKNSTNPVINISNLSISLKYSNVNSNNSFDSHLSKKCLENVESQSMAQDRKEDCLISDGEVGESCDELIESNSDNSVEYFIKHEPRLFNSIVKLEDIAICHRYKKLLRTSPERCAINAHDNRVTRLGAHTRFLRSVKRRAIQNLNRTTKKEESKRKYNTRSSNRENRVRFKIEHGTLIVIGRNG